MGGLLRIKLSVLLREIKPISTNVGISRTDATASYDCDTPIK